MSSPYLGVDFGEHRTGLAISESGKIARPLSTVAWKAPHHQPMIEEIVKACREHEIATIVVGMPRSEDGSENPRSMRTRQFMKWLDFALKQAGSLPKIEEADEYHSTQDALRMFPDVDKDAAAAAIILQNHLDESGGGW